MDNKTKKSEHIPIKTATMQKHKLFPPLVTWETCKNCGDWSFFDDCYPCECCNEVNSFLCFFCRSCLSCEKKQ